MMAAQHGLAGNTGMPSNIGGGIAAMSTGLYSDSLRKTPRNVALMMPPLDNSSTAHHPMGSNPNIGGMGGIGTTPPNALRSRNMPLNAPMNGSQWERAPAPVRVANNAGNSSNPHSYAQSSPRLHQQQQYHSNDPHHSSLPHVYSNNVNNISIGVNIGTMQPAAHNAGSNGASNGYHVAYSQQQLHSQQSYGHSSGGNSGKAQGQAQAQGYAGQGNSGKYSEYNTGGQGHNSHGYGGGGVGQGNSNYAHYGHDEPPPQQHQGQHHRSEGKSHGQGQMSQRR
jgi:hypothetical protein